MNRDALMHRRVACVAAVMVIGLWAGPASGQVTDVVIGITPSCPYGKAGCWAGARDELAHLDGVDEVGDVPDAYNCTIGVRLKHPGLPDVNKWRTQFKARAGDAPAWRGVEVTVVGSIEEKDGRLLLRVPAVAEPVVLSALKTKIQWNYQKAAPRGPEEPGERLAYDELVRLAKAKAKGDAVRVEVTGPLNQSGDRHVIEVREFQWPSGDKDGKARDGKRPGAGPAGPPRGDSGFGNQSGRRLAAAATGLGNHASSRPNAGGVRARHAIVGRRERHAAAS